MKLTAEDCRHKAKRISDDLLCFAGSAKAKKIAAMVKKNLVAEYKRRKNL